MCVNAHNNSLTLGALILILLLFDVYKYLLNSEDSQKQETKLKVQVMFWQNPDYN